MNKYATGLMFLPLVELDQNMEFEGMLADSVTAEDERNFLVHIDDKAVWSDGTPVTADHGSQAVQPGHRKPGYDVLCI